MKKWQKVSLSLGLASTLIVPSFASAAQNDRLQDFKENAKKDLWQKLNHSEEENAKLAYKQKQEMKDFLSTDTVIVKYDKPISKSVHARSGAMLVKSIPSLGYDVVKLAKGQKLNDVLSYYSKVQGVKVASPSVTYKTSATSDPKKAEMYQLSLLNIDKALTLAGNHKVTVAVIDTGMDTSHPDLKSQVLPPYNVLDPAKQPFKDVHGTHVAGIIASTKDNGIGGHGINPNAKILPIDVFNGGWGTSDFAIAEGILYAVSQNVDIINMSITGPMESPILEEAIDKAVDAGITIVAAAGNFGAEMTGYPAAYEGVIAVGSVNDQRKLSDFSSYGAFVDVVAPGEGVYSTVFDYLKGSTFTKLDGTSMASPVVAGIVSLLKSKNPDLTPYEIEAILKSTATDLGDKGFDIKYGYGLVDPVKALQYNVDKLPNFNLDDQKDAFNQAKVLTEDVSELTGSIVKPGEVHWVKVPLEEGEGVQTALSGARNYNYEIVFHFFSDGAKKASDKKTINKASNGENEGYFYQAKEAGTLLIGVKDVYGNYNPNGDSNYKLNVTKVSELLIDSLTAEEPMDISSIPFTTGDSGETLTFAVEANAVEADKDYFRFSVDEPQTVKFNLSAVPGVNSSIAVYFEEDFYMERPEGYPEDIPFEPHYVQYINNNGQSEGEQLVLEVMPGMNYLIEVSAEPRQDFWFDFYYGMMPMEEEKSVVNSSVPYVLSADSVEFSEDEDGLPMMMNGNIEEKMVEEEITTEEYKEQKRAAFEEAMEVIVGRHFRFFGEEEMVQSIVENAIPFKIGDAVKGQIQFGGDEDYYTFTPESDSIVHFELGKTKEVMPWVTVFEYDNKSNDLFPIADISAFWVRYGGEQELKRSVAVQKDKTYVVRFMNELYQAAEEEYSLSTKWLIDVPKDNDLDNNKEVNAKILKVGQTDKNHLIYNSDVDFYYYKHKKEDNVFGLKVKPQPLSEKQKAVLPKELHGQLVPFLTIVEDTNGNLQLDKDEYYKSMSYYPSFINNTFNVEASFKAKKDVGYFYVVNGFSYRGNVSIEPYDISMESLKMKDEDAGSVVKNNVPSKPAKLSKVKNGFEATGVMNAGIDFGDKDYYKLTLNKDSKLSLSLSGSTTLDGVVTIYSEKGEKLGRYDNYIAGDSEIANVTLAKGNYYIMVEDANGYASTSPYKLTINHK